MGFTRDFLFLHEAAKIFRVSVSSIRRYCDEGQLRYELTPGGHRRIVGGALMSRFGATANIA